MERSKRSKVPCAVFVHAGAGYHSRENEAKHLKACSESTRAGMIVLQTGATAVEAVEMALSMLEDNPITNAGYGSNLTAKGVVECDASIMDHLGRSGAAGAVPSKYIAFAECPRLVSYCETDVKNPIMLARKIYDEAYRSPGMSRVPPNFIVGEGATEFAWDHNIPTIPPHALITDAARERWTIWTREIEEFEADRARWQKEPVPTWVRSPTGHGSPAPAGVAHGTPPVLGRSDARTASTSQLNPDNDIDLLVSGSTMDGVLPRVKSQSTDEIPSYSKSGWEKYPNNPTDDENGEDRITDTVGAIAIDRWGNIAAGSSSGGIGMKHRGRVGPAALIGIGTHVIPADPADPEHTTTAVVTSGTGEHIASTLAASTCATRIYYGQKMGPNGVFEPVSEEEALHSMISNEFTGKRAFV
ncbi:Asparaginase family protein [Penicillium atrosanguineum]|uniref:Asparaginase family protein n=1 Tax=Penicillium atrosanguineum TaxID=1132637 RepID=A0A9W9UBP7_9EURO|nr:Asparaginase family protein [Penicillium atrosanguineum]